ncbi:MAG: winged helix-turn-helix domain-containing protein [Tannerella sp.]|nr:winged helix-turn-helix domain-containing protein [Tannerella sp.]
MSIREIGEYTHFQESFIYYSLGWLARENKIRFFEKEETLYVRLEDFTSGSKHT